MKLCVMDQLNQLRSTILKMEEIFNILNESIAWININGTIQWCNVSFDQLVEKPHIQILGQSIFSVLNFEQAFRLDKTKDVWQHNDLFYQQLDKNLCLELFFKYFVDYQEEKSILLVIYDVTKQRIMEKQLAHLAHFDILTNLPNRLQLETYLKRVISKSKRYKRQFALMFLDLDKFKPVNDTYGHTCGDVLLKMVADRLLRLLRAEEFTSRLGGDEFIVVIDEISNKKSVFTVAKRIIKEISSPYEIAGQQITIGVSIGIAFYPEDGLSYDNLMHIADERMYHSKRSGNHYF